MCPQADNGEDNGRSTLSTMAAGDVSQTTPPQIMHVLYCVVLHKLHMCNLDSCKNLTCYVVCND